MEEAGHYYTVYFTSLAAGFKAKVAHLHALLAQMPDMVGWMDASHMQQTQIKGQARGMMEAVDDTIARNLPSAIEKLYEAHRPNAYFPSGNEVNLSGQEVPVDAQSRFQSQYVFHSLINKNCGNDSADDQRRITTSLLDKEHPLSLKFGWLLHRLGDTYAHSVMDNETHLYTVSPSANFNDNRHCSSFGHLCDWHDPDYPFLRQSLFYDYLKNLFYVLQKKAKYAQRGKYTNYITGKTSLSETAVLNVFRKIFEDQKSSVATAMRSAPVKKDFHYPFAWKTRAQFSLIQEIKLAAVRIFKVNIEDIMLNAELLNTRSFADHYNKVLKEFEGNRLNMSPRGVSDTFNSLKRDIERADFKSCR